jgi:hypothetical protein
VLALERTTMGVAAPGSSAPGSITTAPDEAPASAPAAAAPPPAAGAPRAPSPWPGLKDTPFLLRLGLAADRGQPGRGQQGSGEMAVPARPVPDLFLGPPGLPFCLLAARLCNEARRGHIGVGSDGDPEEPGLGTRPSVARLDDPGSPPVIDPWPLLALGNRELRPGLGRPAGDHRPNHRGEAPGTSPP